jgi:hypothetical protein
MAQITPPAVTAPGGCFFNCTFEEAARQSLTPDELAARVLAEHIPARRHLGFVAIGESTSGRTAAEAEEMLAEGFGR